MAPSILPFLACLGLTCGIANLYALTPTEEAGFTKIRPAEVQAFRDENLPAWQSRFTPGKGRLFFNDAQWRAKIDEISRLTGKGAEWRTGLQEAAERILSTPIPVYIPPEKGKSSAEGWQCKYGDSLVCLAAAAKIDPKAAYREKVRQMTLAGCRFESWGRIGKQGELPNRDLAAAHMSRAIAIAYDWHRDLFTAEEAEFIRSTMSQRMADLLQGLYGDSFWASWYTQNHNYISTAALGLAGTAFLGEIPQAADWLAAAALDYRRVAAAMYPDGSIFEGALYWGYGRSFMLQFIEGSKAVTKMDALYEQPFLRNSAAFRIACSAPGFNGVLLWGDSRGHDSCGPQPALYRFASQYHDSQSQYLADQWFAAPQSPDSAAWALLWYDPSVQPAPPSELDRHMADWDVVTSRSGWGTGDYMFSFKGGYNQNHHTKIDAGALTLNLAGDWLLMAPAYGLNPDQPGFFNKAEKRWEYFSNATESHSTLLINGTNQRFDLAARGVIDSYVSGPNVLLAGEDLTQAYHGVQKVRRDILHHRGDYLLVLDEISTPAEASVEWLAQVPPATEPAGKALTARGLGGSLTISRLEANSTPFEKRAPTVPYIDVSPAWMATYSSKTSGTNVRLVTLLRPVLGPSEPAPFKTEVADQGKARHIGIEGKTWRDDYWWAAEPTVMAQPGANISAKASLFAMRRAEGRVISMAASQATQIESEPIRIQSEKPFAMAWESFSTGAVLNLGTPLDGTLRTTSPVFDKNDRLIPLASGSATLPAGRYFLAKNREAVAALRRALAGEVRSHPAQSRLPISPLPPQPVIPKSHGIRWEAEDGVTQQNGEAVAAARSEASGRKALLNFGSVSPEHSVEWTVDIPEPGLYQLEMRYALGQPKATFAVLIDGGAPSPEALQCSLDGPKGWGSERYWTLNAFDWREASVKDSSGRLLALPLSKGKHTLRLTSPSFGINLDHLGLHGTGAEAGKF